MDQGGSNVTHPDHHLLVHRRPMCSIRPDGQKQLDSSRIDRYRYMCSICSGSIDVKHMTILAAALALTGCATAPTPHSLGSDTYTLSELDIMGGNVVQAAARHCASMKRQMMMVGNTTQRGFTGTQYAVVVYRCTTRKDTL